MDDEGVGGAGVDVVAGVVFDEPEQFDKVGELGPLTSTDIDRRVNGVF